MATGQIQTWILDDDLVLITPNGNLYRSYLIPNIKTPEQKIGGFILLTPEDYKYRLDSDTLESSLISKDVMSDMLMSLLDPDHQSYPLSQAKIHKHSDMRDLIKTIYTFVMLYIIIKMCSEC